MGRIFVGVLAALALAGSAAAQPKAEAPAPKSFKFEPKTQVDGDILQVIFGERALFRLDDGGKPVLDSVDKSQLAAAHPPGAAKETYTPPAPGLVGAALDGSAEKQVSVMKVWNRLGHPIEYRAILLVLHGQNLAPVAVPTCPVPAGGVRMETWPAPVVAVGLSRFKPASAAAIARCAGGKPAAGPAPKPAPKKGK